MRVVPWSLTSCGLTTVTGLADVALGLAMREPVTTTSWPGAFSASGVAVPCCPLGSAALEPPPMVGAVGVWPGWVAFCAHSGAAVAATPATMVVASRRSLKRSVM